MSSAAGRILFPIPILLIAFACTISFPPKAEAVIRLGSPNAVSLSNGLVGYWPLDGAVTDWNTNTTRDLSGNGNTGTLISMSTTTSPTPGKIGQALQFDGSSSYIDLGSPASLVVEKITICAWIRPTALSDYYLIYGLINYPKFYTHDSALLLYGGANVDTAAILSVNKWQHVCATNDNSNTTYYLNGTFVQRVADATVWSAPASQAKIGQDPNGVTQNFPGALDDVRVYNRALSADEVKQLYTMGR
jgi:hypothetical protein